MAVSPASLQKQGNSEKGQCNDVNICYQMSSSQLDGIWRLEQRLQSLLLNLPLRQCTAMPSPTWGEPMPGDDYRLLKRQITRMYITASNHFEGRMVPSYGFGLYKIDESIPHAKVIGNMPFNKQKSADLGYLIAAPRVQDCPTAHRYLRSPYGFSAYLGGPISLANHDCHGNVVLTAKTSTDQTTGKGYHSVRVYSKKGIKGGDEITWDYYSGGSRSTPLYEKHEWFLKDSCCSEGQNPDAGPPPSKRNYKRVRVMVPRRVGMTVQTYRPCLFCGKNLDAGLLQEQKSSYQRHLALNHALEIAIDVTGSATIEIGREEFLMRVAALSTLKNRFKDAGYQVLPACRFFKYNGVSVPANPTDKEKSELLENFSRVSKLEYKTKRTVYLCGRIVPTIFEHLVESKGVTNYRHVLWVDNDRPRTNDFSVSFMSVEQRQYQEQFVSECFKEIHLVNQDNDYDDDDASASDF